LKYDDDDDDDDEEYLVKRTSYEAPHYAVLTVSRHFLPLRSKDSLQHPVLYTNLKLICSHTSRQWCKYSQHCRIVNIFSFGDMLITTPVKLFLITACLCQLWPVILATV